MTHMPAPQQSSVSPPLKLETRHRLREHGPQALSEAELLSLIVALGTAGAHKQPHDRDEASLRTAVGIISEAGGVYELRRSKTSDLCSQPGLGEAKATAVIAAIELGCRIASAPRPDRPVISSPKDVDALMRPRIAHLDQETLVVLLLDTRKAVISSPTVSVGTVDSAHIHPREVFKPAVKASASDILLVHNHPAGSVRPSSNDVRVTRRILEAGELFGIELVDHVIIGDSFLSLKEEGYL